MAMASTPPQQIAACAEAQAEKIGDGFMYKADAMIVFLTPSMHALEAFIRLQ
jgi:hypothetical protein